MHEKVYSIVADAIKVATTTEVSFAYAMQDHTWPALKAKKAIFSGVSVGNCWPHAMRKMVESMRLRLTNAENKPKLVDYLRQLHAITDETMMGHAAMLFYDELDNMNEAAFKSWFEMEYDHNGVWLKWFLGALHPFQF